MTSRAQMPPYTIPPEDSDLLDCGVVLTPQRLAEVRALNEETRREEVARARKRAAEKRMRTVRRQRETWAGWASRAVKGEE